MGLAFLPSSVKLVDDCELYRPSKGIRGDVDRIPSSSGDGSSMSSGDSSPGSPAKRMGELSIRRVQAGSSELVLSVLLRPGPLSGAVDGLPRRLRLRLDLDLDLPFEFSGELVRPPEAF